MAAAAFWNNPMKKKSNPHASTHSMHQSIMGKHGFTIQCVFLEVMILLSFVSALYSIAIWPFDHLLDHLNFHKLPIEGFFSQTLAPSSSKEVATSWYFLKIYRLPQPTFVIFFEMILCWTFGFGEATRNILSLYSSGLPGMHVFGLHHFLHL